MTSVRTATLAEVYARQGHFAQACEIYRELLRDDPGNSDLARRLEELEQARMSARDDATRQGRIERLRTLMSRIRKRRRNAGESTE